MVSLWLGHGVQGEWGKISLVFRWEDGEFFHFGWVMAFKGSGAKLFFFFGCEGGKRFCQEHLSELKDRVLSAKIP